MKFEYCIVSFNYPQHGKEVLSLDSDPALKRQRMDSISELGRKGWELVSALQVASNMCELYFKREIHD